MAKPKHGRGERGPAYHILDSLGGIRAVARHERVPYARVLKWSSTGIPHLYWWSLMQLAEKKDVKLTERMLDRAYKEGRKRLPQRNGAS